MGKNESDTNLELVDENGKPLNIYGSNVSDLELGERRVFKFSAQIKEQDNKLVDEEVTDPIKE